MSRLSSVETLQGSVDDPVEVGADDRVLGAGRLDAATSRSSSCSAALRDLVGQLRLRRAWSRSSSTSACLLVALAELLLDGLELLAQEVLALRLVDLGPHVGLDLGAQLEHLELARQDAGELAQPLLDVGLFEQLLLVFGLDAHGAGHEERQGAGLFDVGGRHLELFGQVRHERDDAREDRQQVGAQGVDLFAFDRPRLRASRSSPAGRAPRRCSPVIFTRCSPCTRMRMVLSGSLTILWARATVPTW